MVNIAAPILHTKSAFDANQDSFFSFQHTGNQVFKNRLIVRNNLNNQVVYDNTITSFQMQHPLPSSSLTNGNLYNANVTVFDKDDVESPLSNTVVFYCFTTPTWRFTNLNSNQIIQNSSYEVELIYEQVENEFLDTWTVYLYDSRQQQIFTSGTIYQTDSLTYIISNLEDNYNYYLRATGITINGMQVDTGYIAFSAEYIQPSMFAILNLENQPQQGNIKIESNMISIVGKSTPEFPEFIDDDKVDLTGDGSRVRFDEGFSIKDNFTLQMLCSGLKDHSNIMTLENDKYFIKLEYHTGVFEGQELAYFILKASNSLTNYVINSNYEPIPLLNDIVYVWLRRVNNVYDLRYSVN